jgi:hypothetical protein
MKTRQLRYFCLTALAVFSLVVSYFAAPLCACLNTSAKAHDCCDKMMDHCPMKSLKGDSLDKTPRAGCSCSVEKRQTAPTKSSENGRSQKVFPALLPDIQTLESIIQPESAPASFTSRSFTQNLLPKQHPARAPPCL